MLQGFEVDNALVCTDSILEEILGREKPRLEAVFSSECW